MTEHIKLFVQGDVKPPQRKAGDAGIDFFIPNLGEPFIKDLHEKNPGAPHKWGIIGQPKNAEEFQNNKGAFIYVGPGEDILIPTFVSSRMPENVVLIMTNKSGVALNQKFVVGANTIDSSYQGIIHIHLINSSNMIQFMEFGQKIVQCVPHLINNEELELFYDEKIEAFKDYKNFISKETFYEGHDSHRGDKGFGEGTGTK